MAVRIQNGQTERIWAYIIDKSGDPLTGLTNVELTLQRKSDGQFYTGSVWQTASVTITMTELDATNAPGWYYYDFNTSGLSDDEYRWSVECADANVFSKLKQGGEIKAGDYVDNLDAAVTSRSSHSAADIWAYSTRTLTSLGASLVQEIWDRLTSLLTTAGSIGKLLVDNINATISSRSSHSAADVDTQLSGTHGSGNWEGQVATSVNLNDTDAVKVVIAKAMKDQDVSAISEVVGSIFKDVTDKVKELREGNQRLTFNIATVEDSVRKVAVGVIDNMVLEIKADADADWSSPVSTKTLYFWYDTLGDVNPIKVGEDG